MAWSGEQSGGLGESAARCKPLQKAVQCGVQSSVPQKSSRRRQRGFSLSEMLIVTGITGILAATALPSLAGFVSKNRITGVTNEFVFALQTARSEAIKRIRPVVVCPSLNVTVVDPGCTATGYESGWIVYVDDNNNSSLDAGEPVLLRAEAPEGNISITATGVATRVRFNDSGASVQDNGAPLPGSLTITAGDSQRGITVQANGRVRSRVL